MTDPDATLITYLTGQAGLTALTGNRIYAGLYLPKDYRPETGPALLFSPRGGGQDYTGLVLSPSYQFRSCGATLKMARELDRALYDVLDDIQDCTTIKYARMEVIGQPLLDQATGWPMVLSFYRVFFNN